MIVRIGRFCVAGWTLLELTVAVALLGLILAAVVVLTGRGMTAWQRADGMLHQRYQVEKGLMEIEEELRNAESLPERPFEGAKDRLSFAVVQGPVSLSEVAYLLHSDDGRKTLTREWRDLPAEETHPVQIKKVVSEVTAFSIQYATSQEVEGHGFLHWVEDWDTSRPGFNGLPQLVRIHLESRDRRGSLYSVTRDVWIPHGIIPAAAAE